MGDSFVGLMLDIAEIQHEEYANMGQYTSLRTGGNARVLAHPANENELIFLLDVANRHGVEAYVIGNGTNLLVSDDGIDALVVRIGDAMGEVRFEGNYIHVGAGALFATVAKQSVYAGLGGLEWAAGIPGSVGGAVAMNAGAYGGEIKSVLSEVRYIENGSVHTTMPKNSDMAYRKSVFSAPKRIVTDVTMRLIEDDGEAHIRMDEYSLQRRMKQPLAQPSAGSTFKRPKGYFAAALIEQVGLKGESVGGAEVSPKHAGFIVNTGKATSSDVYKLIKLVQSRVFEHTGIMLEMEVRMLGKFEE